MTDASDKFQSQSQPLKSDNEGKTFTAFISSTYFVLYKLTQRVKPSDILIMKLPVHVFNFIIQWHKLKTSISNF